MKTLRLIILFGETKGIKNLNFPNPLRITFTVPYLTEENVLQKCVLEKEINPFPPTTLLILFFAR